MGILDDAIREHLDLKRRLGAADDELKRLEDEAFGPPSRPGDPDFPETGEQPAQALEDEAPTILDLPAEELAEPEPAPEAEAEPAAEPEIAEPEPEAIDEGAGLFDQGGEELDLDLDLEEEIEDVGETSVDEPEAAVEEDVPIETLPTVEHHFEEAIDEADVVEDAPEEPATPSEGTSDPGEEGTSDPGEEEGEDVLEETPEFLRDAPEDDELWFEQGEPKDFDF